MNSKYKIRCRGEMLMLNLQRESFKANKQRLKVKQQSPLFSFQAKNKKTKTKTCSVNKHTDILYLANVTEINLIIGNSISLHMSRTYVSASIEENNHLTNESANLQTSRTHLAKSRARFGEHCVQRDHPLPLSCLVFQALSRTAFCIGSSCPWNVKT